MPMTHYRQMSRQQAAAALEEFLDERGPALRSLGAELAGRGLDPDEFLDATPGSLTSLWRWIVDRRAELMSSPVEPRERWPSWARHTVTSARVPSRTMFLLLDGLVSYLAVVLIAGAPNAQWVIGSPQDPGHHLHHHPVLTGNGHQIFVPTLPMAGMLRLKCGQQSLRESELEQYAERVIADLRTGAEVDPLSGGSPVVVVAEPDGFDVGVHPVLAARRTSLVGIMAHKLAGLDGVVSVFRRGPDALEVQAPDWNSDQLEQWLNAWMKTYGPFIR
ncbi:hypothetical protein [Kocuria sp. UCD-OTCP]|uniref:hypothetical protein n=1 Tax=Kocuria sp. UCD-OTCP TaxID=1292021 RepID=UPI00037244C3|nr:hypothetical protein [Kocuria sp. UCD-OTCP]EYT47790.1 hypothetical protein H488_0116955 [Kocuria sp. UCD-OTCP]